MSRKIYSARIKSIIFTTFILFQLVFPLSAQNNSGDEKVMIGGQRFTLYMAVSGDSPISISRKFGITLDDLIKANPEIKNQLNSGQTVKIPVVESISKPQVKNGLLNNEDDDRFFIFHLRDNSVCPFTQFIKFLKSSQRIVLHFLYLNLILFFFHN